MAIIAILILGGASQRRESKKFEKLYNKVCSICSDKNLVVFTHMPMDCWSERVDYHKNFVYVSGHTHRNYFYDDGDIRVYADNQIGYKNKKLHMKWFDIENEYDDIETVEVASVVDGDTIKVYLEGERYTIRMIGIDTPESVHPDESKKYNIWTKSK